MRVILIAISYLGLATATFAASVPFPSPNENVLLLSETDFDMSDVTVVALDGPTGGQVASTDGAFGNPAPGLVVETIDNGPVTTAFMMSNMTYDVADATIRGLRFTLEYNALNAMGSGHEFGVVIEQGGAYFTAFDVDTFSNPDWRLSRNLSFVDLEGTFAPVDGTSTLDLSDTGDPLTFGFYTSDTGGAGNTVAYDNFTIQLIVPIIKPVPLPAGFPLLLLGVLGLGLLRRRA